MDVRIWSPARAGLALDRHNLWLVTVWFVEQTHRRGQFVPTSTVVLNSPEWLRSFPSTPLPADSPLWRAQLDAWVKTEPGRDYESFSAWLYALDLFIPLDALGQEKNGPLSILRHMGRMGSSAALAGANGRLGDYGRGRGGGHRVDRSAGLTFAALRVMGGPC